MNRTGGAQDDKKGREERSGERETRTERMRGETVRIKGRRQ